jgi:hypothetical protein
MAAWTCARCKRLVPERLDICRCGALRDAEAPEKRPFPMGIVWVVAIVAVAGWAGYSLARPPAKMAPIRIGKPAPNQITVIEVPVDRPAPDKATPVDAPSPAAESNTPAVQLPNEAPVARPRSEEEQARALAESVYRPRMEAVAQRVTVSRTLTRRYVDACMTHTVTTRTGSSEHVTETRGAAVGVAAAETTYTDADGNIVGYGSGQGASAGTWREVVGHSQAWSEVTARDNSTTPECRALWSDIQDVRREVDQVMTNADQEAVRRNVWTWLQTDVPRRLAEELWR